MIEESSVEKITITKDNQTTSTKKLERQKDGDTRGFKCNCIKIVLEIFVAAGIALLYYKCLRVFTVSETVSLNDDSAFPFHNLYLNITKGYNINAKIYLSTKEKEGLIDSVENKQIINISEIFESKKLKLILRREYNDYLTISLKIDFGKIDFSSKNEKIFELVNSIYYLDSSNNSYKVNEFLKLKYFYKNNLEIINKKGESRIIDYFVHSHSIDIFGKSKNFSVIDDSEIVREYPKRDYDLAIRLVKKKYINVIKVTGDSFFEYFTNKFALSIFIVNCIFPPILCLFSSHQLEKKKSEKNFKKKQLLVENEELPEKETIVQGEIELQKFEK